MDADGGQIRHSAYKTADWRSNLAQMAAKPPHKPEIVARQTDVSDLIEGLYIKVEEDGKVCERYKYVRHDFLTTVTNSESHWHSRPILPNRLASGTSWP